MPSASTALSNRLAAACYRLAAKLSAGLLGSSPMVESVLLHRSAATGEIAFGRSDIDILMIVDREQAGSGQSLASLYQLVRRAQWLNPAMNHVELFDRAGLTSHARMDTYWGSVERRAQVLLYGKPTHIPAAPVNPDHALCRFLLWVEWFFAIAVQQKNRRNLRKLALESWNAYAVAEGLMPEPCLLRAAMEAEARQREASHALEGLEEAKNAVEFVFNLADRLHGSRRPPLRKLARPVVFDAITAPLCLRRRFVVLPEASSPLPAEVSTPGAFPCTPEILDLFIHAKNPFFYWAMPDEILSLGIQPPAAADFLRSCRYYGHGRFLFLPGFADRRPQPQRARLGLIRRAIEHAIRNQLPPAVPQEEIENMMRAAYPPLEFYRAEFDRLRRESETIQEVLDSALLPD